MSRKLRHYFEFYKIVVVTEFPMGDIPCNKEANGCIIKWAIKLGTYSIEFKSRPTIKSQALANFVAEWTEIQEPIPRYLPRALVEVLRRCPQHQRCWCWHFVHYADQG